MSLQEATHPAAVSGVPAASATVGDEVNERQLDLASELTRRFGWQG